MLEKAGGLDGAKFSKEFILALEAQRYEGYHLDAYGANGQHASIRLVQASVNNIEDDPWGWFKVTPIKPNEMIIALESERYPGYFLDAYDGEYGSHAQIRMVNGWKSRIHAIANDPWGWFKMKYIKDKEFYALESMRYPGFYLDAYGDDGSHASIRLVRADPTNIANDPWGWFKIIKI